jgi:YVTN family beta-propeller protein
MNRVVLSLACIATTILLYPAAGDASVVTLPDGRTIAPIGFTIPLEGFVSSQVLSPDGRWLAALSQDGEAVDLVDLGDSRLAARLAVGAATGMTWTSDGLYITCGYTGTIARYAYVPSTSKKGALVLNRLSDLQLEPGLLNGIAEDPATHRVAVARTADREVVVLDDQSERVLSRLKTTGQPFDVGFAGGAIVATLYDSDQVDAWANGAGDAVPIHTGAHPTRLLVEGSDVYVGNADGSEVVVVDAEKLAVAHRFHLAIGADAPPGQTPSGMALSDDRATLFVAESGFNDVAVLDTRSDTVLARIPTGWYPTAVTFIARPTSDKDPRVRAQLWIASAKGLGSQPDPGGEWDGTYTSLLQHIVVEPRFFAGWSQSVARNDRFALASAARPEAPPIRHFVFIVRENKHFDEEFGDEARADADPTLLLYGRSYTPNAHALAERFTLFDNFMTDGEKSDFGHSWTTQAIANDYLERNGHVDDPAGEVQGRVPWSIWPFPESGEDGIAPATMDFDWYHDLTDLPDGPRINVSGVFGPRGELIDALRRAGVSFRVYGEQMTMLPDGRIAPGLASHAARTYPGDHINFGVLDTERAKLFLDDVRAHGLAAYSYLTLPTDHTAGTKPGFYTPASYVANNDAALGQIIEGLSKRSDWRNTVVFVTCDDAQGTGDHVDSHRMPAFMIGPYVRRDYVSHVHYSQTSVLRTVEVLFGVPPLNVYDAAATPILDAFARQPVTSSYTAIASSVPLVKNPGKAASLIFTIDGPASRVIPGQEWESLRGTLSLAAHQAYLQKIGATSDLAEAEDR